MKYSFENDIKIILKISKPEMPVKKQEIVKLMSTALSRIKVLLEKG